VLFVQAEHQHDHCKLERNSNSAQCPIGGREFIDKASRNKARVDKELCHHRQGHTGTNQSVRTRRGFLAKDKILEIFLAFQNNQTKAEEHQLDGVDLDVEAVPYERQSEFQPYADAVVALTQELAKRLPGKLLTHAPQPPYLCRPGSPGGCPADSLYATILAATGDDITWLNMQYYSNPPLTSSNFEEVYHYRSVIKGWEGFPGLEAQRLVVGKPYSPRVNGFEPMDVVVKDILRPLAKEFGSSFIELFCFLTDFFCPVFF